MGDAASGAASIDRCMAAAWPAEDIESFGEWTLRSNGGTTRRANSALASGGPKPWTENQLCAAIDTSIGFYRQRGQRPIVMVSSASAPANTSSHLVERGWVDDALTDVMRASARSVAAAPTRGQANHRVVMDGTLTAEWFELFWSTMTRTDVDRDAYRRIVASSPKPLFASVDGAGVGQAVIVGDIAIVQCMATREAFRGRGVASAILGALARELVARETDTLALAVMRSNSGARRLYERAGFTASHVYSYLVAPS